MNHACVAMGLAVVVLARRAGSSILCAHFVVDLLACGLVDCYGERYDEASFDGYLDDLDRRITLQSCDPGSAALLVRDGARRSLENNIEPPEELDLWLRLLPPREARGDEAALLDRRLFGRAGRPLVVAELLSPPRLREDDSWVTDCGETRLVVRAESPTEH